MNASEILQCIEELSNPFKIVKLPLQEEWQALNAIENHFKITQTH